MVTKKNTDTDVSMSNTKKEIIEAYNDLVEQLEAKAQSELKPEIILEKKKAAEVVKVADTMAEKSILTEINDLRVEMSKTLTQISEKIEVETEKYKKIQEAIIIKDGELKEIFEIERSAHALAALIGAQNQKKLEFEAEMSRKIAEFDNEMNTQKQLLDDDIQSTRIQWNKEKQANQESVKERDEQEKKLRQRHKEEFEYNFNREQELASNQLTDEREKQEKQLALDKEDFEKSVKDREKDLLDRETSVAERESRMKDLEENVAAFPKELETHIAKAIKNTSDRLNEAAKKNEAFIKIEAEGKSNVLQMKIESLEVTVTDQAKQLAEINERLEKAYGKVQDIAVKAIEGSANKQTLAGIEHIVEKNRRHSQEQ
jgi:hypothetical protein